MVFTFKKFIGISEHFEIQGGPRDSWAAMRQSTCIVKWHLAETVRESCWDNERRVMNDRRHTDQLSVQQC